MAGRPVWLLPNYLPQFQFSLLQEGKLRPREPHPRTVKAKGWRPSHLCLPGLYWAGAAPQLLLHFPRPLPSAPPPFLKWPWGAEGVVEPGLREGTGPVNKFFPACSALNSPDPSQAENSISLKQLLC